MARLEVLSGYAVARGAKVSQNDTLLGGQRIESTGAAILVEKPNQRKGRSRYGLTIGVPRGGYAHDPGRGRAPDASRLVEAASYLAWVYPSFF